MCFNAVIILLVVTQLVNGRPQLKVTIDCSSEKLNNNDYPFYRTRSLRGSPRFDIESFCKLIRSAIPSAIEDGRVIDNDYDFDEDQLVFSDTHVPVLLAPPPGFPKIKLLKPRYRSRKVKVPRLNVPKLKKIEGTKIPPRLGIPGITRSSFIQRNNEETSAEKVDRLKKGVEKMLHVVKVLSQVDQYLSERTRIVVDKLSKTFTE